MPVRSRGPLLAGMAGLLSLCAAAAGCQMSPYQNDAFAIRSGPNGGGAVLAALSGETAPSAANPTAGTTARKPLFAGRLRPTPQEPVASSSPAVMLRPVPAGAPEASGSVASAWQPAQRAGAGEEAGPAVLEQPVPVQRVSSTNTGEMQLVPPPLATSAGPEPGKLDELHPPRLDPKDVAAAAPPLTAPLGTGNGRPAVQGAFPAPGLQLPDAPREFAKRALSAYIIEPPDILAVQVVPGVLPKSLQPVSGTHIVRMDGTIGLGIYGSVFVAGRTLDQAKVEVARLLVARIKDKDVSVDKLMEKLVENIRVDVSVYNSKFYYVITDGGGYGEQVIRVPSTGNETVLDALSTIQGLPPQASKTKIWVARATPANHGGPHILPVDWCGIAKRGEAATNYQIFPGDRIYVQADKWIKTDSWLAKRLAPIERVLGTVLLGASTVNSIKGTNGAGGAGGFR